LAYGRVILLTDSDCFTDDTALLIKKKNEISVIQIKNLFNDNLNIDTQLIDNVEVWSDTKWVPVKAIRKKMTNKRILTINTYSGIVRCTEDHTFLLENGKEIKAKDIKIGDKLLRNRRLNFIPKIDTEMKTKDIKSELKKLQCYNTSSINDKNELIEQFNYEMQYCSEYNAPETNYFDISQEEAWLWGFFFADGSCGIYTFEKDREKTTEINTNKSRNRWQKWVIKHTDTVNKHTNKIEELLSYLFQYKNDNEPCS
jgi:hypothetical protein